MEDEGKMEMNYLSQKRDCIIFIEGWKQKTFEFN